MKPANLLLTAGSGGTVKLSDFGMVKFPELALTRTAGWIGSDHYISPEQRTSSKHVDARTDLYALGVTAYRMLTGTLPIGITREPHTLAPEVGQDLSRWVLSAIEPDRADRPASAAAMIETLDGLKAGLGA